MVNEMIWDKDKNAVITIKTSSRDGPPDNQT